MTEQKPKFGKGEKKAETAAVQTVRRALIGLGVLLPTLSLVPFGSLWLWQHGLLLYWGIAAVAVTGVFYAYQAWLLAPRREAGKAGSAAGDRAEEAPDEAWSPREEAAWRDVLAIADSVDVAQLRSRDDVLSLGRATIEAVARRLHPEKTEPLWQFTVPEALALIEQVSARLRPFIVETVPLGDRITVGQALALYRWRSLAEGASAAYDLWRALRLLNPLSAAASEIRERMSKKMLDWGREEVARRLARAYVREVGRAAIDLYGGRLRVRDSALETYASAATRQEAATLSRPEEPLRLLLCGQRGAGKSSLVNALAKETLAAADVLPATAGFQAYELAIEGVPSAVIVDSPGLPGEGAGLEELLTRAGESDLVILVVAANRADRGPDREALDAIRRHFMDRPDRRPPVMLAAAAHIDRLRPFREWAPPYDLCTPTSEKARSIRAAVEAIAADLDLPPGKVIPVRLEPPAYNVDALWGAILEALPEARRARLVRILTALRSQKDWSRVFRQAVNAGRFLIGAAMRP